MAHIRTATASNDNIPIEIRRQARRVTAIWTRMEARNGKGHALAGLHQVIGGVGGCEEAQPTPVTTLFALALRDLATP